MRIEDEVVNSTDEIATFMGLKEDSVAPRVEHDRFLVSFLVDARGGSMRGSRHQGLRLLVPPSAASAPTRVTCRMLRPERTAVPPQLNDGEGLACRIIELGPHPCSFNSPVLLEIPHFAALRGRQREVVVLRSDDAETWKEHSLEATDQAVRNALGSTFDSLETSEQLREKRILRILLTDFPQYLAVVSRLRQEIALIGSDGGVLSSTVVTQVQAVFPEGALKKRIRVGLQAHQVPVEMVTRVAGSQVAVSPIVTVEPRRRKFHKPITLTIPLPRPGQKQHHSADMHSANSSLRLLCSITGGTSSANWEDITGSTPLSRVKDCVSFTTTVSARFWLIDCPVIKASAEVAMHLYQEASAVPYMGKFIVFAKRPEIDEALIRAFCITDDKVDKTLECQEGFDLIAASGEVEVTDNQPTWLETSGNLKPVVKVGDQLRLHFLAFRENRLAFPVRIQDTQLEPSGKLAFVKDALPGSAAERRPLLQDPSVKDNLSSRPICGLDLVLPSMDASNHRHPSMELEEGAPTLASTTAATSVISLSCTQPAQYEHVSQNQPEYDSHGRALTVPPPDWAAAMTDSAIARTHLDMVEIATAVGSDWPKLAKALFCDPTSHEMAPLSENLTDWMARHCSSADTLTIAGLTQDSLKSDRDRALAVLLAWITESGDMVTGNELDIVLRHIGREDIVKNCMRDIRPVLEIGEREQAANQMDGTRAWNPSHAVPEISLSTDNLISTSKLESGQMEGEIPEFSSAPVTAAGDRPTITSLEPSSPESLNPPIVSVENDDSIAPTYTIDSEAVIQPEAQAVENLQAPHNDQTHEDISAISEFESSEMPGDECEEKQSESHAQEEIGDGDNVEEVGDVHHRVSTGDNEESSSIPFSPDELVIEEDSKGVQGTHHGN